MQHLFFAAVLMAGCAATTAASAPVEIPFVLASNHIYVRATFQGQALSMMLDTGATASYAAARGCTAEVKELRATLTLAGVSVPEQRLNCWTPHDAGYDGFPIDGLLGYDFVARFVVEMDYDAKRLVLHDPAQFAYQGRGKRAALTLIEDDSGGRVPLLPMTVEAAPGKSEVGMFIVDTGARTVLTLGDRFARKAALTADAPGTIRALIGGGAMLRKTTMAVRRAPAVVFAGLRIANPVITVSEDKEGRSRRDGIRRHHRRRPVASLSRDPRLRPQRTHHRTHRRPRYAVRIRHERYVRLRRRA